MLKTDAWIPRSAVLIAVLMLVLQVAALAQDPPPAKAPVVPPEEGRRRAEKAQPDEATAARRARAEALRGRWQTAAPRGAIQMIVEGENIYILYGTYLCQFSANGLELKAKVDLRQVLGLDKELKQLRRDRGEKRGKVETPDESAAKQPEAEPAEE